MPLPVATIGLALAAAGLKMYHGGGVLADFLRHPLDILAGHREAATFETLVERYRKWTAGNKPLANLDLEKAVTRSAILADLFCLSPALTEGLGGIPLLNKLRERFGGLLGDTVQGIFSQAEELTVRPAFNACRKRLQDFDQGGFVPAGIDARFLLLPARGGDYAATLSSNALAAIEREHGLMPEKIQKTFKERWFGYLCLSFHEEIKTNDRARHIFVLMQTATGFLSLEQVVREEAQQTRGDSREQHEETWRLLGEIRAQLVEVEARTARADAVHPPQGLRGSYLSWVVDQARVVPLAGVDPRSIREDTRADLDLAAVYTALMTQSAAEMAPGRDPRAGREARRLSAIEVLDANRRLALLGDPGSGKSTFVKFVALCLAGEMMGRSEANLSVLATPPPGEHEGGTPVDETKVRPQPWHHGALLPVRIVLRDFAARGLPAGTNIRDSLWTFIVDELPKPLSDFAEPLRQEWLDKGGFLLLDGLDEVPEAEYRREQVKQAVQSFAAVFTKVRILVTSRTYAYQKQAWKLDGFAQAVLAPFERGQIERFVERWYAFVGPARSLPEADSQGRAMQLKTAIARSPRLAELASRPLLLTLMASLHAWRGGSLPEQREELYADAVELLLSQWEGQKLRRNPDGTYVMLEPSLAEWLEVDQKKVRGLLNRMAFEAHRDQQELHGTADIAQDKLVTELLNLNPDRDARPARLIEYISDRAGLLEPRGVKVYAFPHRTFQEYLAACYLTEHEFPEEVAGLLRPEPNRWREVALLAGAKSARGTPFAAWLLAEELCPKDISTDEEPDAWGALLAAQVLIENHCLSNVARRDREKVERIRRSLVLILKQGLLPPVDRVQAGDALAEIGDPRDLEELVPIPPGEFSMGSPKGEPGTFKNESPQHQVHIGFLRIGKYSVTVAQWQRFVDAKKYPGNPNASKGLANHPVVYVSWRDAMEFCAWLTQEWRRQGKITETDIVRLPTEAEWEKAARGSAGYVWPWGNEFDSGKANTGNTGIGKVCAVGCFPTGASPYGVLDTVGNVWQWCQSKYAPYHYQTDDGREDLSGEGAGVLRGGAFSGNEGSARCAFRNLNHPDDRNTNLGFRVVVVPRLLNP